VTNPGGDLMALATETGADFRPSVVVLTKSVCRSAASAEDVAKGEDQNLCSR
jgi:hypothetical protein